MWFGKDETIPELNTLESPAILNARDTRRIRRFDATCLWVSAAVQKPVGLFAHYEYNLWSNVVLRSASIWIADGQLDSVTVEIPRPGDNDWSVPVIAASEDKDLGRKALEAFNQAVSALGWIQGREKPKPLSMLTSTKRIRALTHHQHLAILGAISRRLHQNR